MSPILAEDSVLLTLPFGGAVLQSLGVSKPEIDAILEDFRKTYMEEDKNFNEYTFDFLSSFRKLKPHQGELIPKEESKDNIDLLWSSITGERAILEEIKVRIKISD
jgi:hypothetical protein